MVWTGKEGGEKTRADRKGRGAFFTAPPSAALLAGLARGRHDWSDPEAVREYRVCDPACGAGILLKAVEDECARLQLEAGHLIPTYPLIVGLDIDQASLEEAARVLNPDAYLFRMPYGEQPDGSVAIGALELLAQNSRKDFWQALRDVGAVRVRRNG